MRIDQRRQASESGACTPALLYHGSSIEIKGDIETKPSRPIGVPTHIVNHYVFATANHNRALAYAFKTPETYAANVLNHPPVPFVIYLSKGTAESFIHKIPLNGYIYSCPSSQFQENIVELGGQHLSSDEWHSNNPVSKESKTTETISLEQSLNQGLQIFHIQDTGDTRLAKKFLNDLHLRIGLAADSIQSGAVTHLNPLLTKIYPDIKVLDLTRRVLE